MRWLGLAAFPLFVLAALLLAQPALTFPAPKVNPPDKATAELIAERTARLDAALKRLRQLGARDPALADVEVFHKAAVWIAKHNEYFGSQAKTTLSVLDQGLLRASQVGRGEAPWQNAAGQTVARAYRSRLDGSVQPFAVTYPHDYGAVRGKRYRIDIVLHGRTAALTEVSFLHAHRGEKEAPKELDHVRIDIFGRGNNAYRWAGEVDVWEAVENFLATETFLGRGALPDTARVVLRGFSMGGAGTWHLGLHRPDQFVVLGPGAGFTTTHGYVGNLPKKLPDYQEACLHIYDAVDYAENAFNVPIVAYTGELDKQIAAANLIEARLKKLGLSAQMTHVVAPKLEHTFPAEWQKKAEALYAKRAAPGKPDYPDKVRFVTWTMKYASCYWVELLGLDQHYKQARVEAEKKEDGFAVTTANVRAIRLGLWPGATREAITVSIDGQKLENVRPHLSRASELNVYLEKQGTKWAVVLPERLAMDRLRAPRKTSNLQGPIDDAFMGPFLCVRGTGTAWNEAVGAYARADLERFAGEWSKYLRGELPVKDDTEVTAEDLATKHLVLFGDPGSNSLIADVVGRLPLGWTRKTITWGGKEYDASSHVPVLIYPSPLAPERYVVLNSGHTFRAADFRGTNALLYPRLGDRAILKLTGAKDEPLKSEVVTAGLFDDQWK